MKTRGFTLIELLVVIVILGLLITLGAKGLRAARINAGRAQAQVEIRSIETAIQSYHAKYGKLPSTEFSVDQEISEDSASKHDAVSADIIAVLSFSDESSSELNPSEMVFLDVQSAGSAGEFMDPWGYQYRIALDTDYDGQLQTLDGLILRRKVAVVSVGLYQINGGSDTNDLITSWQ